MGKIGDKILDIQPDELIRETDAAILFRFDDAEVWIPKSQITMLDSETLFECPMWLAILKEIEDYAL